VTHWLTHLISLPFAPPTMPVEEFDEGGEHVVRVEMPGVDPSRRVRVVALDGVLCIRAELDHGSAANRIRLPMRVDRDSITARYEHGILEVRMSVTPTGAARTVKVRV
jgi:HSP20 family protein